MRMRWALGALGLLLWVVPPDALAQGQAGMGGGEHRALRKQVELLRAEVKKPRDYFESERAQKLKDELRVLERVLEAADELHTDLVGQCQLPYLEFKKRFPDEPMPQEFFLCAGSVSVPDDVVKALRRRAEVERRLKDNSLTVPERTALKKELAGLQAVLERAQGLQPLMLDGLDRVTSMPDAGP